MDGSEDDVLWEDAEEILAESDTSKDSEDENAETQEEE